jgi:transmembrane 9 superfamily protein 2/4
MNVGFSFQIEFMQDIPCKELCTKSYKAHDKDSEARLLLLKKGMSLNYQHHWIVGK